MTERITVFLDKDDPGYDSGAFERYKEGLIVTDDIFRDRLRRHYRNLEIMRPHHLMQDYIFRYGRKPEITFTFGEQRKSPKGLIKEIAIRNGFSYDDILSGRRSHKLIKARHEAIYALRKTFPKLSFPQIGRLVNKDHSTVIHAFQKMEKQLTNPNN